MNDIFIEERDYRDWLIAKVNVVEDYTYMLRELYNIEFYSLVKYDEDRGMDGMALREAWSEEVGYTGSLDFGVANVLEVLIGIAMRIEFQLFGSVYMDEWDYVRVFWELVYNLGIDDMYGTLSRYDFDAIHSKVTQWMDRTYKRNEKGNIFMFMEGPKNLQKMNIWDQMGLFIREKWPR